MNEHSAFDNEADRELGDALRAALSPAGGDAFVRGVMARLDEPVSSWDVLGAWARPGMAAALLLAAGGGFWFGRSVRTPDPPVAVEEALTVTVGNGAMTALVSSSRPPAIDVLFVND